MLRPVTDLTELDQQRRAATEAVAAHCRRVEAEQRERHPDSPQWTGGGPDPEAAYLRGSTWPQEDIDEVDRLQTEELRLVMELHRARRAAADAG